MDYDMTIHHNPDAVAWAKFFIETTKDMERDVFRDEGYMIAWFANSMMAMHDSMKPHEAANKIERLRKLLNWWLCSSNVDATMQGPIFRGVSGSRRDVWQATLDEFELEEKEKGKE
jgi:hypothetical protein